MSRKIPPSLRKLVAERAKFCCEFCTIPEQSSFFSFEIDHIISVKHGGITEIDNLANSCFTCNNNKGSDVGTVLLPDRQFVRLFDPRKDSWAHHFEMENGVIYSKTKVGEATIKVLKMNDIDRIIERREVFA